MRHRLPLAALLCALLCQAAPFATFPVGSSRLSVEASGDFRLVDGDRVLIDGASVVIAAPGWQRSVGLRQLVPDKGYPCQQNGDFLLKGTIPDAKSNVDWAFAMRVTPQGKSVRVVYELTPNRDAQISEAPVFLDLPLATWSEQTVILFPAAMGTFPKEKPGSRHFLTGMARQAVLGTKDSPLSIAFDGMTQCTVQDSGKGENRWYQLYPRIARGPLVKAGEKQTLAMTFTPNDPTPVEMPVVPLADDRSPAIGNVRLSQTRLPCYDKLEIEPSVQGTWTNPFDPDQVSLDARITDPSGKTVTVPGFFLQDYLPVEGNAAELEPQGKPRWLVRYAAAKPGPHRVVLVLRNQGQERTSPALTFTALPARDPRGFVRVSRENSRYLQFDNGTPFFAIGENIAVMGGDLAPYIQMHEKLAAVGGNFVRWWICRGGIDLESGVGMAKDQGLGRIRQPDAWRLDRMLETAERLGIRVMACLETQQNLRREKSWGCFSYNRAFGGPVDSPRDFFTSPEAARFFRHRLRYIVARWGYSTSIFSWQFWNEVSACNDFVPENAAAWHRDMAAYLREVDPYQHVIHTNFGNLDGNPLTDSLPGIEVMSSNSYCRRDMGYTAWWAAQRLGREYHKPFLLTEYGVGHHGGWMGEDPTGIIVHNGLWGALMGGAAGTGLPWGWSNWVDVGDFYHYWQPLAKLVKDVPFCKREWQPVQPTRFAMYHNEEKESFGTVFVEGWPRNYSYNLDPREPAKVYQIPPDGRVVPQESLRAALWGGQSHTFATNWPRDGIFRVHVPEISWNQEPKLEISLDGKVMLTQAPPRGGTVYWHYWQQWEIPVPAGEHTLTVRNAGTGAIWTAYELTNYRRRLGPDLDVFGLSSSDHILLWLRHPEFIWLCQKHDRHPAKQPPGQLTLQDIPPGIWTGVWIDTITGKTIRSVRANARDGTITLPTPEVTASAAIKLKRIGGMVD
jgi:hypothetical protein